jgi:hypothetical protein
MNNLINSSFFGLDHTCTNIASYFWLVTVKNNLVETGLFLSLGPHCLDSFSYAETSI